MKRNREDCESLQENKRVKTDKSENISDLCKLIEHLEMAETSLMDTNLLFLEYLKTLHVKS